MNTPNRDMIRDVIRLERETPSYNKCLLPHLFEDIIKQLWPLREPVSFPEYNKSDLPMGFDDDSEFGLWYATKEVSDPYIDFDTID